MRRAFISILVTRPLPTYLSSICKLDILTTYKKNRTPRARSRYSVSVFSHENATADTAVVIASVGALESKSGDLDAKIENVDASLTSEIAGRCWRFLNSNQELQMLVILIIIGV